MFAAVYCACTLSSSLYADLGHFVCDGTYRRCRAGWMVVCSLYVRLLSLFSVFKYHNKGLITQV